MSFKQQNVSGHSITIRRFGRIASVALVWSKEDLTANTQKTLSDVMPDWAIPTANYIAGAMFNGVDAIGYFMVYANGNIVFKPTAKATYVEGSVAYACVE